MTATYLPHLIVVWLPMPLQHLQNCQHHFAAWHFADCAFLTAFPSQACTSRVSFMSESPSMFSSCNKHAISKERKGRFQRNFLLCVTNFFFLAWRQAEESRCLHKKQTKKICPITEPSLRLLANSMLMAGLTDSKFVRGQRRGWTTQQGAGRVLRRSITPIASTPVVGLLARTHSGG